MCHSRFRLLSVLALAVTVFSRTPARAQCPDWGPGFNLPGVEGLIHGNVFAFAVFDDGTGPALYLGGRFQLAGDIGASAIVRWNGSSWSALGTGMVAYNGDYAPYVASLAVYDDGTGPALYAGGRFGRAGDVDVGGLAKWNGSSWSSVSGWQTYEASVLALAVLDTGSGPALYLGGDFTVPDGHNNSRSIARWDGTTWTAFGSGLASSSQFVSALAAFDDGSGPALYVGGRFTAIGNVSANRVAKWDGSAWVPLGSGIEGGFWGDVHALSVYDDGSGPRLVVGGDFTLAGGVSANCIARWDGSSWSALGLGLQGGNYSFVQVTTVFDDGAGPALYAGGDFSTAGMVNASHVARWDGSTWSALGEGLDDSVYALANWDDGSGSLLYAGGLFLTAGGAISRHIARWDRSTWGAVGGGSGVDGGTVASLASYDDGSGPALYAGGGLWSAGGVPVHGIARWKDSAWSSPGTGMDGSVNAMKVFDDGSGTALFAGGGFSRAGGVSANSIAKWNGSNWAPLGSGVNSSVLALTIFDDGSGPALYAGGSFTVAGGVPASYVAKWNGSVWSALGSGVAGNGWSGNVRALTVFDDGSRPALFVAGFFDLAGGASANFIAKWDGSSWTPLGEGMDSPVNSLLVYDDRTGPALYAAGFFTMAGGASANRIAKWDGSTWTALASGITAPGASQCFINALAAFDEDGWGPALYAAGSFSRAEPIAAKNIVRWNGSSWSPVGSGITLRNWTGAVSSLAVADLESDGTSDLYLGGDFVEAGDVPSENIAQWRGCEHAGVRLCFGDGSAGACPCGNSGLQGRGCNNAINTGGARLAEDGQASLAADTLVLTSSGERDTVLSLFFQGDQPIAPAFDGDGLRCTGGHLKRLYVKSATGGVVTAPATGDPSVSARSAALGDPLFVGATRMYQVYYRDKSETFCPNPPGNTWNTSSAVRIDWRP